MKKNKISLLQAALTLLSISLIIWSLWPLPQTRRTMTIDPDFVDSEKLDECGLFSQLLDYEFELVYPRALWKAESSQVLLTLRRASAEANAPSSASDAAGACSLALETRLILSNLHSEPGDTILEPFVGADTQSFVYTISPLQNGVAKGEFWIYAVSGEAGSGASQRLPLFAVPMEMRVWTLFGQPPALVRYLSLLVLLILIAISFRQRLLRQE